jgi:ABC-type transport system substrate-binding protein
MSLVKPGAPLRVGVSTIGKLDPATADDLSTQNVLLLTRLGLVQKFVDESLGNIGVSEYWERENDGAKWTFHIRPEAKWNNGDPVTSMDFKRSWLRALAPDTKSLAAEAHMMIVKGALAFHTGKAPASAVGIVATNPRELVVTLEHPIPWFDEEVALPVFLPVHAEDPSITNGLWTVLSQNGDRVTLKPNRQRPETWGTYDGTIEFESTSPPAWMTGPGFLQEDPAPRELGNAIELRMFLWLNTSRTAFRDVAQRRAVAAVVQHAMVKTCAHLPIDSVGSNGESSLARSKDDLPNKVVLAAPISSQLTQIITKALRNEGVRVWVRHSVPTVASEVGNVDAVLTGWRAEFLDDYNYYDLLDCSSNYNLSHWCSQKYHDLMHRTVREMDDSKRQVLEQRLEHMLTGPNGAYPVVPLYQAQMRSPLQDSGPNLQVTPLGYLL